MLGSSTDAVGRIRALEPHPAVFLSAHREASLEPLRETLRARMRARLAQVVVTLPVTDGEALAALYREGEVLSRADEDGSVVVEAPKGVAPERWIPVFIYASLSKQTYSRSCPRSIAPDSA